MLVEKAKANNTSLTETIKADAKWLADQEFEKEKKIKAIEAEIKKTPIWLENVETKSKTLNIPLIEMIRIDAEYIYNTNNNPE